MPSHLKSLVRARMEKTGESYEQALRHVRAEEHRAPTPARDQPWLKSPERAASVADTAFIIAAVRAEESSRPEHERLFEDPYAAVFAAGGAHVAEAVERMLALPYLREGVRLRTKHIDDVVREGLAAGLSQVLLLGAGFDARGYRMPEIAARGARVFEVDTAAQLERKKRLLAEAGLQVPARVAFVPCDFHETSLEDELPEALAAQGFRLGAGAIVVWEGVIGYIDDRAIQSTFEFVATWAGPKSRLVFTYGYTSFEPMSPLERVRSAGFGAFEDVGGETLWQRTFGGEAPPEAASTRIGTATV